MTNAEKYLKDEASIEELIFDIINFEKCWNRKDFDKEVKRIKKFFFTSLTPTLTEDERVILRNIDSHYYTKIFRNECLFLHGEHTSDLVFTQYDHLFQFIKERRSILYKRIIGGEKMSDFEFYMGLLKIFGRYINESILDDEEKKIFDEMIYRSDKAVERRFR